MRPMTREQFFDWIAKPELPKVTAEEARRLAAEAKKMDAIDPDGAHWFNEWYWEDVAKELEKEDN